MRIVKAITPKMHSSDWLKKCRSFLDMKGFAGAILMDLSKAFGCLNHELLIAKLEAYCFSRAAPNLVHDYLSNRKQRVRSIGHLVPGRNYLEGYRKAQFWDRSYLMHL